MTIEIESTPLWLETPLIYSSHISSLLSASVYLKLENLHPSQSFKYRGISHFINHAKATHGPDLHCIIASGGNAGIAGACAANVLKVKCTVYIPEGVSRQTLDFLKKEGAEVVVAGKFYAEALKRAEEAVRSDPNGVMIPAYDDPIVWEGHSSMVTEIARQIPDKPDAIFCSVGGGGLLGGLVVGCKNIGWDDVPLVALETIGSNCFYQSIRLNSQHDYTLPNGVQVVDDSTHNIPLAHLTKLTSRASGSLGASQPSAGVVKMVMERRGGIRCVSVPDEMSMQAVEFFAEDHKMLAELACATTLTAAYKSDLLAALFPSAKKPRTLVFIVCGGFKISMSEMVEYRQIVEENLKKGKAWEVLCDGETWTVQK
ncbi:hypothetical protein JAAARDRAFT_33046 [Jaapia argillacea MUCL 33604]|uniref:L-serine ammonia-lyase n=1 Tax=Jaapia argillacea MUCL 33604 TaxID=933084 RepID=A0A067PXD6_9AGAM|nr:hypothetical protein JAAARDRAFT_33046 [Jaapia argillacea MUCL 33604]